MWRISKAGTNNGQKKLAIEKDRHRQDRRVYAAEMSFSPQCPELLTPLNARTFLQRDAAPFRPGNTSSLNHELIYA